MKQKSRRWIAWLGRMGLFSGLVGVWLAGFGCSAQKEPVSPPDLVLHGGKIVTVDDAFSYAEAVAITGDRIQAVGDNASIQALAGPETELVDLKGKTVVPGLADDHFHSVGGGPGVDLSKARTLADVARAIQERASQSAPGELVITNADWHEAQLKEQRLPLRRDLDQMAPDNPVVVVRGGHELILNSKALQKWGITADTVEPQGGRIGRYPGNELNGELIDNATDLVELPKRPDLSLEQKVQDRIDAYKKLLSAGVTSVRYGSSSVEDYRLHQEMKRRGELPIRISQLLWMPPDTNPEEVEDIVTGWGIQPNEGDHELRIVGVKLLVDGGFEGALLREPYSEPWGKGGTFRGVQTMPTENYHAIVKTLNELGWRVATHAVGDAAIDLVLDGYEAAHAVTSIVGRRWGIEHAFLPAEDQISRIKKLSLFVSAQHHLYVAGPSLEKYWGRKRAEWTTPMRFYLDQGVHVAGGTDSPVIPYAPMDVIYHFVTRDTISGGVFGAEQGITREEALRVMTLNNAFLNFEEHIKGSIQAGKLADLVVLSDDIMTCREADIRSLNAEMTVVGGRVAYRRKASELSP